MRHATHSDFRLFMAAHRSSNRLRLGNLVAEFVEHTGLPKDEALSVRSHDITWARMCAMAYAHEVLGYSLPHVGRAFRKDHTTVLNAVRKVRASGAFGDPPPLPTDPAAFWCMTV